MATIRAVQTDLPNNAGGEAFLVSWALITENDTCEAVELYGHNDRSIQVEGTFGGATITIKGSNDGTNYETIRDPAVASLTFAVAGLKGVLEAVRYLKPATSGGVGSSLTVTMICKRTKR